MKHEKLLVDMESDDKNKPIIPAGTVVAWDANGSGCCFTTDGRIVYLGPGDSEPTEEAMSPGI